MQPRYSSSLSFELGLFALLLHDLLAPPFALGCHLWLTHLLLPCKLLTQFTLAKDPSDHFVRRGFWI
ncbi:hypothetical protein FIBSPDRAFT_857519 [Athelia psychrophila]|uniref:Secreted protein n=1 Tax=Athelia psychrophila TaxID=1759441 RepID=A0A166MKA4_9AGAM|nr:hypothetical protein FIBSPDRAFT_857519 [Fibularhizoctonia sp. CBS 109695]